MEAQACGRCFLNIEDPYDFVLCVCCTAKLCVLCAGEKCLGCTGDSATAMEWTLSNGSLELEQPDLCARCFFVLDMGNSGFALCESCGTAKLCPRCAVADCSICLECKSTDLRASKETMACKVCETLSAASSLCHQCKVVYCENCFGDAMVHDCIKCSYLTCITRSVSLCCDRKLCTKCYERHQRLDCANVLFYHCPTCHSKVLTFGPERTRCPVVGCVLRYGCQSKRGDILDSLRGVYCQPHTSKGLCSGCRLPYALDPALGYGDVRIVILLGTPPRRKEYCGVCFNKIRALVESVLIVVARLGKPADGSANGFPKVLMDKIVLCALDILNFESKHRACGKDDLSSNSN